MQHGRNHFCPPLILCLYPPWNCAEKGFLTETNHGRTPGPHQHVARWCLWKKTVFEFLNTAVQHCSADCKLCELGFGRSVAWSLCASSRGQCGNNHLTGLDWVHWWPRGPLPSERWRCQAVEWQLRCHCLTQRCNRLSVLTLIKKRG